MNALLSYLMMMNYKNKYKKSITQISYEISECARNGFLSFSAHAEERLKERELDKNLLVKAISENGSVVAVEKAKGEHNASDDRFIVLADIGSMPVRVMTTPKKVFAKGRWRTKYIVVTAYSDVEYFATNQGTKSEQFIRNYTVKRSKRPARELYVETYKQYLEAAKKKEAYAC